MRPLDGFLGALLPFSGRNGHSDRQRDTTAGKRHNDRQRGTTAGKRHDGRG